LVLDGRIFTMDALLTQRAIAATITAGGGHYVMPVKGNQPQLLSDIHPVCATPVQFAATCATAETTDYGHGRVEWRELTMTTALHGYLDWPGAAQGFRVVRRVVTKRTGEVRTETVYGITSLAPTPGAALQVLRLVREHWQIANRSHWVRDVTFGEDASQVRSGSIPQVMAALRNTVVGLLRQTGAANLAAARRYYAANPAAALALLGIVVDN
jgi:predicted transposase YbfD/YdcC